ncbi:MAG: DMT family transporter, partial [Alphaproteobacteria bacterium]|nr:DMT family transporter [Alphaproteobacteria bacterium]
MSVPTLSRRENLQGHLAQLISTSCHVSGFVLYKDVIATIPATQVAATQLALGALILWVMALATNRPLRLQGPVWRVLALGVLAPAWIMLFMAFGTARTTATNATIMWGLVPLLVPILGAIILREHLRIAVVLGAILGFSGTLLIVSHRTGGGSGDIYGDILVFCAIMCACATQLSGRRVNQYFSDWLMVTCYQVTVSALVAFVVMLIMDPPDPFLANADWKAALKLF